jgi:nicotinamidase-related amidase
VTKPALIVIDVQKEFFQISETTTQSLHSAIEVINAAIVLFREKEFPVVSVQHINESIGLKPGSPGFDIPEELEIAPGDLHIHKTYSNAFNKTGLADRLREMQAGPLILAGFCAEYCVLSTYRGALDQDFKPIMLQGGLASETPEHIRFVEHISDGVTFGALKSLSG